MYGKGGSRLGTVSKPQFSTNTISLPVAIPAISARSKPPGGHNILTIGPIAREPL